MHYRYKELFCDLIYTEIMRERERTQVNYRYRDRLRDVILFAYIERDVYVSLYVKL